VGEDLRWYSFHREFRLHLRRFRFQGDRHLRAGQREIYVGNSGEIVAGSKYGATGIAVRGFDVGTYAEVANSGTITSSGLGIFVANYGDTSVESSGAIYAGSEGILVRGTDVHVDNSGTISVGEPAVSTSTRGIDVFAQGDVDIGNTGDILVAGSGGAVGISAQTSGGDLYAYIRRSIEAHGGYMATGISLISLGKYLDIAVVNTGDIEVEAELFVGGNQRAHVRRRHRRLQQRRHSRHRQRLHPRPGHQHLYPRRLPAWKTPATSRSATAARRRAWTCSPATAATCSPSTAQHPRLHRSASIRRRLHSASMPTRAAPAGT
jgi:hypothetical protein